MPAEFEVQPAAEAVTEMQLQPVGHATVRGRDPAKTAGLEVRVLVFAGARFGGMFGPLAGNRLRLWLPPGNYTLDVRAGDGRCAKAEVRIAALDDHPVVEVELPAK